MAEYEAATPEQKLNIATYFIMSSPTGEVDEVVGDVRKLVGDEVLSDAKLSKILGDYNMEQCVSAPDPDGAAVLVSAYGQVGADTFVDPASGRILRVDHKRRKYVEVTDKKQSLDDGVAKYRAAIDKELASYVESSYKTGKCVGAVYGTDAGLITVVLSAANVHLGNFWTGGWKAVYQLSVGSQGNVEMKGDIKVNVHYFEDGNVQLHTKFPTKATIAVSDAAKTAAAVVKSIKTIETDFQANLEHMYINMHSETFKHMRRFFPITKQPMNWNLAAHKVAGDLGGGSITS
jgi:capping protein alpha